MTKETTVEVAKIFDSIAPIKVRAVKCLKCGCIVYSRCLSDRRTCLCGAVALNGGPEPYEGTFRLPMHLEWLDIVVDKDLNDMYYDWNLGIDRLGMVYPEGNKKHTTGFKYIMTIHRPDGTLLYVKGMPIEEVHGHTTT